MNTYYIVRAMKNLQQQEGLISLYGIRCFISSVYPGILLCIGVSVFSIFVSYVEIYIAGTAFVDSLVISIIAGAIVRTYFGPRAMCQEGIRFSAKYPLEFGIVLMGASLSGPALAAVKPSLLIGVFCVVIASIALGFAIGRWLRLSTRTALLIACGNGICGNSAIAAIAPIIKAEGKDVAIAISFTAMLGVVVVALLPVLGLAFGMGDRAFGALAGLTAYAVPQAIAAASPFGSVAVQVATVVKLARVLMLGPVCFLLSLTILSRVACGLRAGHGESSEVSKASYARVAILPWFVIGFSLFASARVFGLIPASLIAPLGGVASALTLLSMAALGLSVDLREVAKASGPATLTVLLSLLGLAILSVVMLRIFGFL